MDDILMFVLVVILMIGTYALWSVSDKIDEIISEWEKSKNQ